MKATILPLLLALTLSAPGCDRRKNPENAPTPQPTNETRSPPADPEQPTAPVETPPASDQTPADPKTGT